MALKEVKTYNPKTGGYLISYVDVPAVKNSCSHENSTKLEVGPNMGDGDPAWEKHRCNICGETYYTS